MDNNVNTDLIRDHVDSFILRFLASGDSYGYDIHKAISTATEGVYEIKQPTLYSCLKRLEKQGFIISYDGETSNGAQRKYYSITDKGRSFLNRDIEQWEFSRTLLNRLLSDKEFDLATAPKPFDPSELRPRTKRGVGLRTAQTEDTSADEPANYVEDTYEPDVADDMTDDAPVQEEAPSSAPDEEIAADTAIFGTKVEGMQLDLESYSEAQEEEEQPPILQDFLADRADRKEDDYRSALNDMFAVSGSAAPIEATAPSEAEVTMHGSGFNYGELKERAQANGYKLRPYSKTSSSSYYSMNFIFSTRLKRDTLFILYAFMLLETLIGYFLLDRFAGLGYVFYIVTGCILLLIPIFGVILYLLKPDKRIRADFDLKIAISGTSMIAINAFIICMLLAFFAFNADITRPVTMVKPLLYPALLLIDLPIYSLIYAILYNTRRYHLK